MKFDNHKLRSFTIHIPLRIGSLRSRAGYAALIPGSPCAIDFCKGGTFLFSVMHFDIVR